MRIQALTIATVAALSVASTVHAQTAPEVGETPRFHAGATLLGAVPRNDFGDAIDHAFGLGVNARYALDSAGHFGVRIDGAWLLHGWENRDVDLRSPLGGTQVVELMTTNSMAFAGIGPEFSATVGRFRPYVGASAGMALFHTSVSGERKDKDVQYKLDVQHHNVVFSYAGHAGVTVPLTANPRGISLDLGARYQHSDKADFLRKGDVTVEEAGTISLSPVRANADTWVLFAGLSVPLSARRGDR